MAISFPSSPATNQTYVVGTKTWIWNGYAWDLQTLNTTPIFVQANAAFNTGNSAFIQANAAFAVANSGGGLFPYFIADYGLLQERSNTVTAFGEKIYNDNFTQFDCRSLPTNQLATNDWAWLT
jgi:hypothetical protein